MRQLIFGRIRSTPDTRKGRTARWPGSVLPVRSAGGRPSGLYVRVGNVAWYAGWMRR